MIAQWLARIFRRSPDAGPAIKPPVVRFEKLDPAEYDLHLARIQKRRATAEQLRRQSARVLTGQDRRGVLLALRDGSRS